MYKKIFITALILFAFYSKTFALIKITDGIFPSDVIIQSPILPKTNTVNATTGKNTIIVINTVGSTGKNITGSNIKTGFTITGSLSSGNLNNSKMLVSSLGTGLAADIDFVQGLKWMFENGLTSYRNINDYRPYDKVTREEAAKMFSKLYDVKGLNLEENTTGCVFKDSNRFSTSMSSYIYRVCAFGIMKGGNGYFLPNKSITRAQGLAIIIRLFEEKSSNENLKPRYSEYYTKGLDYNFMPKTMSLQEMEVGLSRYRLAKFIYAFHIKSEFKGTSTDLNNKPITYLNFWDVIPDTTTISEDKTIDMKVHLKTSQLVSNLSDEFPIVLETNEKVKMVKITTSFRNTQRTSFVWYGDLYDINNNLIGTSTFIYNNNIVREGYLRFDNGITYRVTPSSKTNDKNIYDVFKKQF